MGQLLAVLGMYIYICTFSVECISSTVTCGYDLRAHFNNWLVVNSPPHIRRVCNERGPVQDSDGRAASAHQ